MVEERSTLAVSGDAAKGRGAGVKALNLPLPSVMETHIERLKRILAEEGLSAGDQAYFDAHLMLSAAVCRRSARTAFLRKAATVAN